jgi:hypothetical protein
MKKLLCTLLTLLVYCNLVFAQVKQHPLIPVSPTAASLGKYGDIDVSLYTGQINPTVKLFNIKFNDFDFPIDLRYASSGLKVQETPASVGMGWSLSGTSVITRQVRGLPDEQVHGFNGQLPTANIVRSIINGSYAPTTSYSTVTEENFKKRIGETNYDSEPDLFNFSFPGGGGKFIFDETQVTTTSKQAVLIPKQPNRIIANFNYFVGGQLWNPLNQSGRIESFEIKDSKNNKYTFNQQEGGLLDDDAYQFGKNIVSTWYLTKIETPNGNTLDFNYIQRTIDLPHAQSESRYLLENYIPNADNSATKNVSRSTTTETVLTEILINGGSWGKVEFIENTEPRADWSFSLSGVKPKSLSEVRLVDGQNNLVKKYKFIFEPNASRLLLRSVQEFGLTNVANEPYVFTYYDEDYIPPLPFEGSAVISQEDHWGYYNSNNTESLLPDFLMITTNTLGDTTSISNKQFDMLTDSLSNLALNNKPPKDSLPSTSTYRTFFITATNRNPDFNASIIGQLKKITYPTKGFTEFEYEPNSYYGRNDEEFNPCAGNYQSIGTVTDNSAANCQDNSATFTIAEGAFSCIKVFWDVQLASPGQDIIDGNFSIIGTNNGFSYNKIFTVNNNGTLNESNSEYKILEPGTYTITVNMCGENAAGANPSNITVDVMAIPVVPGSSYITKTSGGLRIREVRDCYGQNYTDCLTKEYSYENENDPLNSSGRIVTNGKYAYQVAYYSAPTDDGVGTPSSTSAIFLNSASQLPLSTTLGSYIGYNFVTVKEAKTVNSTVSYKGKTTYDYTSPDADKYPDFGNASYPYFTISNDWKRGLVQKSTVFDEAGTWLKKEENLYETSPGLSYFKNLGIKAGKFVHIPQIFPGSTSINPYVFVNYASISGINYKMATTNQEQFKVNGVLSNITTTTNYTYANNVHMQPTQTVTVNSKGENITTAYKYPSDISSGVLLPSAVLVGPRITELLQVETFLNGLSINKKQNFFANFAGNILPSSQKSFIGNSTLPESESIQLAYDSYGNLTSFKEADKITQSLLWAYNGQYPAVYIANGVPSNSSLLQTTFDPNLIETTANTLRTSLPNSRISSFTFKPWLGMLTNTTPNVVKTSFTYDGLNRLEKILNPDGNIVKAYAYQYATTITDKNIIKEIMPRIASTTLPVGYQNVQTNLSYLDGLGRPLQTVSKEAGPTGNSDIISNATTYDGFGRVEKSYLPFVKNNSVQSPAGGFASFLDAGIAFIDPRAFTENLEFDNSPLNQLYKVRGTGEAWNSSNKFTETSEEVTGNIKSFSVAANGAVTAGLYPANSLYKKTLTDEQGNKSIEYTDKDGRTVLKEQQLEATTYAKTAYIYNNIGQLAYIIQPETYDAANSFDENAAIFPLGIFAYKYDNINRQIAKHIPGGGWTKTIYDKQDRPVLEQNELQALNNKWSFTKYDAFDRTVYAGELISTLTQANIQAAFDAQTITNETWLGAAGYDGLSYPSGINNTGNDVNLYNFYDSYDFVAAIAPLLTFKPANAFHTPYTNSTGLATGKLSFNLSDRSKYYTDVMYFDKLGRMIQSQNTHIKSTANGQNAIVKNLEYDFTNQITRQIDNAPFVNQNITINTNNEYDHAGRLKKIFHGINTPPIELVRFTYDNIGRLAVKKILPDQLFNYGGNPDYIVRPPSPNANIDDIARKAITLNPGTFIDAAIINKYSGTINANAGQGVVINGLQTIKYDWHVRGGLRGINMYQYDLSLNPNEGDLFGLYLAYEDANQWNGNIGGQRWARPEPYSSSNGLGYSSRFYNYSYDNSSRLKSATYAGPSGENYSLPNINYDKNGNILNLTRNGKTGASYGTVDGLSYAYTGNRLTHVDDYISGTYEADFVQRGNGNYTYWPDGSLKSDANKTISLITYNTFLKKVDQINYDDGKFIKFTYDGSGEVLKRENSIGETWEYAESFIFKNGIMYSGSSPEGRIVYNAAATPQYNYEFEHRDIWGNLRVSFAAENGSLVTKQTSDFDAMGWAFNQTAGVNKSYFQYQKQERVEDFGLNIDFFKFRPSDPVLGRFWQIDPLAEQYVYNSPYALQENKFGRGVELEGKELMDFVKPETKKDATIVVQGVTASTGATLIAGQAIRTQYTEGVKKLATNDAEGRTKLKAEARAKSPAVLGEIAENMKPMANESSRVTGTANKSNIKISNSMSKLATVGKISTAVSVGIAANNIIKSENKPKQAIVETGILAGAILGGEIGAETGGTIGLAFYGVGAVPGAIIGGLVGSITGAFIGESVIKNTIK